MSQVGSQEITQTIVIQIVAIVIVIIFHFFNKNDKYFLLVNNIFLLNFINKNIEIKILRLQK